MNPTVIAIVGHSGAGKTTLIAHLLPILVAHGLHVATIKHSHHDPALDVAGTDSFRHKQAGAMASMLVTASGMQLVTDNQNSHGPEQLARRYFQDMDMVLAEGYTQADCSKIEVLRKACNSVPRCQHESGLLALVTDVDCELPKLKKFQLTDIDGIARFVLDMHQLESSKA